MQYVAYFVNKKDITVEHFTKDSYAGSFPMPSEEVIFEDSNTKAIETAKKIARKRKQRLMEVIKVTHKSIYSAPKEIIKQERFIKELQ